MAKRRKDVEQRKRVQQKYKNKQYDFPDDATTYDELRREYMKLADIADRRLRRLEEYSGKDAKYEDILKFAYSRAIEDIKSEIGEDATRFKAAVPKSGNIMKLQSRVNDVLKFLNSPTSTMTGIKKVYESRAKTINQKYGMDLSWEDMADFFENGVVEKAKAVFSSETAMRVLGKYYRNKTEIDDMFSKYKKGDKMEAYGSGKSRLTAKQMRFLYENRDQAEKLFGDKEEDETKRTV